MEKFFIICTEWKKPEQLITTPQFANELFTALCDYYGIDSGEIRKEYKPGDCTHLIHAVAEYNDGDKLEIITQQGGTNGSKA